MRGQAIGEAGLSGWRAVVGERVASTLSRRTRLTQEQARALVGLGFVAVSVYYVVGTALRALRRTRD